jgi:hypothetical protein
MSSPPRIGIRSDRSESPSRYASYRARKREGLQTQHRRTTEELARLAALPVEQRSAAEKEAVRNHRKALKRKREREQEPAAAADTAVTHHVRGW